MKGTKMKISLFILFSLFATLTQAQEKPLQFQRWCGSPVLTSTKLSDRDVERIITCKNGDVYKYYFDGKKFKLNLLIENKE